MRRYGEFLKSKCPQLIIIIRILIRVCYPVYTYYSWCIIFHHCIIQHAQMSRNLSCVTVTYKIFRCYNTIVFGKIIYVRTSHTKLKRYGLLHNLFSTYPIALHIHTHEENLARISMVMDANIHSNTPSWTQKNTCLIVMWIPYLIWFISNWV